MSESSLSLNHPLPSGDFIPDSPLRFVKISEHCSFPQAIVLTQVIYKTSKWNIIIWWRFKCSLSQYQQLASSNFAPWNSTMICKNVVSSEQWFLFRCSIKRQNAWDISNGASTTAPFILSYHPHASNPRYYPGTEETYGSHSSWWFPDSPELKSEGIYGCRCIYFVWYIKNYPGDFGVFSRSMWCKSSVNICVSQGRGAYTGLNLVWNQS
jgi:hypothetical protein